MSECCAFFKPRDSLMGQCFLSQDYSWLGLAVAFLYSFMSPFYASRKESFCLSTGRKSLDNSLRTILMLSDSCFSYSKNQIGPDFTPSWAARCMNFQVTASWEQSDFQYTENWHFTCHKAFSNCSCMQTGSLYRLAQERCLSRAGKASTCLLYTSDAADE